MTIEFLGGPIDGEVREVPIDADVIVVYKSYPQQEPPRYEAHTYRYSTTLSFSSVINPLIIFKHDPRIQISTTPPVDDRPTGC